MKLKRLNENKETIMTADLDQNLIVDDEVKEEAEKEFEEKEKADTKVIKDLDKEISITEGLIEDAMEQAEEIRTAAEEQAAAVIENAQELEKDNLSELADLNKINEITSLLKNLIQDEWEAIEAYQQAISEIKANNLDNALVDLIQDILNEEMIHVGQINKAMTLVIPSFANAEEEGKAETAEIMKEEQELGLDDIDAEIDAELNVPETKENYSNETIAPLSDEEKEEMKARALEVEENDLDELSLEDDEEIEEDEEDDEPAPLDISEEELNAELSK